MNIRIVAIILIVLSSACSSVIAQTPEPVPPSPCREHAECFTDDTCIAQESCEPADERAGADGCVRVYRVWGEQCAEGRCEYVAPDGVPGDPVECRGAIA